MTDPNQVWELDGEIERALVRQAMGLGGETLLDELASLDAAEWPDRAIFDRLMASLGTDETLPILSRTSSRRVWLPAGVAALVALCVVIFALVSSPVVQVPRDHAPIPTSGQWRVAGFYESPGWKPSGEGGPAGPLTCPSVTTCYLISGEPSLNEPGTPLVTLNALSVSHDQGATWNTVSVEGVSSFTTALQCPDSEGQYCLVGGMDGSTPVILTTSDGGTTWTASGLPQELGHLSNLACSSHTHCVGVFTASQDIFNMQGQTEITNDAGRTWTPASTSNALLDTLICTGNTCISFGVLPSSTSNGRSVDGTFFSSDGGATWRQSKVPDDDAFSIYEDQVSCPTSRVCWAIAIAPTGGPTEMLVKSSDGGATWSYSPTQPSTVLPYDSISCPTESDCWVGSGGTSKGQQATRQDPAGPLLWSTADGGSTWTLTAITPPSDFPAGTSPTSLASIGQITCLVENSCIAIGQGDVGAKYTATYSNG